MLGVMNDKIEETIQLVLARMLRRIYGADIEAKRSAREEPWRCCLQATRPQQPRLGREGEE